MGRSAAFFVVQSEGQIAASSAPRAGRRRRWRSTATFWPASYPSRCPRSWRIMGPGSRR